MGTVVNLYPVIAVGGRQVRISKRGKEAIEALNREGQIDHDKLRQPFVMKVTQNNGMDEIYIIRNKTVQRVVVNPRGNTPPNLSWDQNDGYRRPEPSPLKQERNTYGARRERQRRNIFQKNPYMDSVLGGS